MSAALKQTIGIVRTGTEILATLNPNSELVQNVKGAVLYALDIAELLVEGDETLVEKLAEIEAEMVSIKERGISRADFSNERVNLQRAHDDLKALIAQAKARQAEG